MFVRKHKKVPVFIAGDKTVLRELFNPLKEKMELNYSLAHAIVKPGQTTQKHTLQSSEVYYILEGKGTMFINQESQGVTKGDTVYIPPNAEQNIKNTGKKNLLFICIVEPAWKKEDETIL